MSEEKDQFEERTVTLKVTKTKGEEGQPQPLTEEGSNCGPWFFERHGGHTYSCRWCSTQGPTYIPYKECIQLPD